MKTISAKELRNNLDQVLDEVLQGKEIVVKHRFKDPIYLSAKKKSQSESRKNLVLKGLKAFEDAPKKNYYTDPNKSMKQIYHEELDKKYLS